MKVKLWAEEATSVFEGNMLLTLEINSFKNKVWSTGGLRQALGSLLNLIP